MSYYNNVTKEQLKCIYAIKNEYEPKGIKIPFCKSYDTAEAVINKYKFTMKGKEAPATKNQKYILTILEKNYEVKLPIVKTQRQAAELIDKYDKIYHILNNRRINYYHQDCMTPNKEVTDNQFLILEGLRLRYGNESIPNAINNRGEAWDFIAKFQDVIYINENGMYIDNVNTNIIKMKEYIKEKKKDLLREKFKIVQQVVKDNPIKSYETELIDDKKIKAPEFISKEIHKVVINTKEFKNELCYILNNELNNPIMTEVDYELHDCDKILINDHIWKLIDIYRNNVVDCLMFGYEPIEDMKPTDNSKLNEIIRIEYKKIIHDNIPLSIIKEKLEFDAFNWIVKILEIVRHECLNKKLI